MILFVVKSSSSLPPALLSPQRSSSGSSSEVRENLSEGPHAGCQSSHFDTKKIALIHTRAILIDSTHLCAIQRLALSTEQSSTNTRPSQTSGSITMSASSYRSILLISSSLALFPPSLLLFRSHVAPAFK